MADNAYGVEKVHGFVATGYESLTSNFEFITLVMDGDDIRPLSGGGSSTSQARLDKLIEIVSERGQPVIMGAVSGGGNDTIIFAIEHPAAWSCVDGVSDVQLEDRIAADGINYSLSVSSVTYSAVLT